MPIALGARIASYEVLSLQNLERFVPIQLGISGAILALDAVRVARFKRAAQVLA